MITRQMPTKLVMKGIGWLENDQTSVLHVSFVNVVAKYNVQENPKVLCKQKECQIFLLK